MQYLVRGFIYSAGAILLFMATALFLVNITSPRDLAPPNIPFFPLNIRWVFWIVSGANMAMALVCLFGKSTSLQLKLISVLATGTLGCRLVAPSLEITNSFRGYLGPVADAFAIQGGTADILLIAVNLYLLAGSFASHFLAEKLKAINGVGKDSGLQGL